MNMCPFTRQLHALLGPTRVTHGITSPLSCPNGSDSFLKLRCFQDLDPKVRVLFSTVPLPESEDLESEDSGRDKRKMLERLHGFCLFRSHDYIAEERLH